MSGTVKQDDAIPKGMNTCHETYTMPYSELLPYASQLRTEGQEWLQEISTHFAICIQVQDYVPGAVFWTQSLNNFLDLKLTMPRSTRAQFARMLYELTVAPGMDTVSMKTFAQCCMRLIKKPKRLGPEDLILPWRPLYQVIEKYIFPKSRQRTFGEDTMGVTAVIHLVEHARRFFPAEASQEILDYFLPRFSIHSVTDAHIAQGYIVLLLPAALPKHSITHQLLCASDTTSAMHFLPTLFSLWSTFTRSPMFDAQFADLLSRIASANLDTPIPSEVGVFTKRQIQTVYSALLRTMDLPVGSRKDGNSVNTGDSDGSTGYGTYAVYTDIAGAKSDFFQRETGPYRAYARFVVYTIMPDEDDASQSYGLSCLEELTQAIELYFHPSNHGSWSHPLTYFVMQLAYDFLKRWRKEHEEHCGTPLRRRLTPVLRQKFVLALQHLVYRSMFGKDPMAIINAQATLKFLAWLEPSLIFPGLLERIYPSLETLTETHRTSSALGILSSVATPLFSREHYPAGGKHLMPLLHLAIPGIDMNDPIKTMSSLSFIATSLASVPMVEFSTNSSGSVPKDGLDVHMDAASDGEINVLSREQEDELCFASTMQFEEWLVKFLRRVFTILENLPEQNNMQSDSMESGLTSMLIFACDVVLDKLTGELYDVALRMISGFAEEQVLPNATYAIGNICASITLGNEEKGLAKFLPLCISRIKEEIENGASSIITNASSSTIAQSDLTLHWYQRILLDVVSRAGVHLLTYRAELVDLLQTMLTHCRGRRGFTWAAKLLRSCLRTILDIYPRDYHCLTPTQLQDPDIRSAYHLLWGQPGDPKVIEVNWHVPSEAEKTFALELLDLFLIPAMNSLRDLMNQDRATVKPAKEYELTHAFCKNLIIMRCCLRGTENIINDDGVDITFEHLDSCARDEGYIAPIKTRMLVAGYAFSGIASTGYQKARKFRRTIAELIHQLFAYFQHYREDDVESIKMLIKTARSFLGDIGIRKEELEYRQLWYHFEKAFFKTPVAYKRYPRGLLVQRVYLYHWRRLRHNNSQRIRAPLHDDLLMDLTVWSLSTYAEIRKLSQCALTATAENFLGSKLLVLPILLDTLVSKPHLGKAMYANKIKGALYLFQQTSFLMPCIHDWRFIPQFAKALCRAQHDDKTSTQELIRKVFVNYMDHITKSTLRIVASEALFNTAVALAQAYTQTSALPLTPYAIAALQERIEKSNREKRQACESLVHDLVELLNDDHIHWRFTTMAANLTECFIRAELRLTASLASASTKALVSELPAMRRIGDSMVTQLLLFIKQHMLAQSDEAHLISETTRNPLKRDIEVDKDAIDLGQQLLLQSMSPIADDPCILVDNTSTGWYVWPKSYVAYVPCSDTTVFPPLDESSRGCYEVLRESFLSVAYWTKLLQYKSQEITNPNEDNFSNTNARLYSSVFKMFRTGPIPAVKDLLIKLCAASDQNSHQRAAAELAGGLIRGSKHWPQQERDELWAWMTPMLQKTLAAVTPDSLAYWKWFTRFCCSKRDPRRIRPLIDIIAGASLIPGSEAAFAESRKLVLVKQLLAGLKWRALPIGQRLLPTYLAYINHPYKQVRQVLGDSINQILQLYWIPSTPTVAQLLEMNAANGGDGVVNVNSWETSEVEPFVQEIYRKLDTARAAANEQNPATLKSYTTTSKTVLYWLHDGLTYCRVPGVSPYVLPLLRRVFYMQEFHNDQDLQQLASEVLNLIVQFSYPPHMVDALLNEYVDIAARSLSWHIRVRSLHDLQVFFFKNLFVLQSHQLLRIMDVVGDMLLDSQIEVRQVAAITLGGLVRCSQRDSITRVQSRYTRLLQTRIPKRKRERTTGRLVEPMGFREALLKKHAGVLGLSCLVDAFPYEVPEWMPNVLCQLAECLSDPAEIQATIRKTFSNFKRTHSDTWHEDRAQFTNEQLSILSDMLISPSYFA